MSSSNTPSDPSATPSTSHHAAKIDPTSDLPSYDPIPQIVKVSGVGDLGKDHHGLHYIGGNDIFRRNNLQLLDNNIICYATGSSVIIENVLTKERKYLYSLDEGGIGCIAIHPKKKYIAVGCRGYQPNIYIYQYPSLRVCKILRGGAERGYSCMTFNPTGDTIASIASAPDYMLTLWSWTEEKILLHSKAFGQEIYTVRFSEYNPSSLTTSGTGHIRFWKMASTFTGMKLQGSIGKFGKVELSDISAFVELPDGKVCSGTESGALLLWEGNFIKCRFVCPGDTLCHQGEITSIEIDLIKGCIVTGGLDGYLRWWDLEVIDTAEVDSDHSMDFIIRPLSEILIVSQPSSGIRSILYHHKTLTPDTYDLLRDKSAATASSATSSTSTDSPSQPDIDTMFILETSGVFKTVRSPSSSDYGLSQDYKIQTLYTSHGSEITSLDCSPIGYIAVTGGLDGRLIFWDICGRMEIASKQFLLPITSLCWIPIHIDPTGQSLCVGFQDGICKVLRLNRDVQISNKDLPSYTITQTMVMKPHNAAVTHISFSNSSQLLVTAGKDGILFFFHCKQKYINGQLSMYTPLRFIRLKKNTINDPLVPSSATASAITSTSAALANSASNPTLPTAVVTNQKSSLILCNSLGWSGSCLFISCSDGIAREVDSELILASTNEDTESYESNCQLREIVMKIAPPPSSTSLSSVEDDNNNNNNTGGSAGETTLMTMNAKILKCVYSFAFNNTQHDKYYAAIMATPSSSSSQSSTQPLFSLQEGTFQSELPLKEYSYGCYDNTFKELRRVPQITCMRYGISREFLAIGSIDGTISLLPVNHLSTYLTMPAHNSISGGVSCISLSYDNKFLLSTGYDGLLVIYRLKPIEILEAAQRLDNDLEKGIYSYGNKTKSLTQDLSLNISSYFVDSTRNLLNFPALYDNSSHTQHPHTALDDIIKILPDIEEISDPPSGSYSIEDAKLKQEEDNKKTTADHKKDKIRVIINKLRKEYEELKYHNSQLPEVIQLSSEELLVDREYFEKLHEEEEKVMTEIHLECEYEMEKTFKLKEKLYKRLMNELLVEEMPLYGLRQKKPPKVYSLRTIGLSPEMNELLLKYSQQIKREEEILSKAKIDAILATELDNAGNSITGGSGAGGGGAGGGVGGGTGGGTGPGTSRLITRGESFQSAANKSIDSLLHQSNGNSKQGTARGAGGGKSTGTGLQKNHHGPTRRELRLKRIETIQTHLLKKPNENDDDERDIQAINHAIKTIGNFSLKSSDTYEVPEDQIINAEKKKRQIIMLQEAMIVLRLQFNERFLLLRKLKIDIIKEMKGFNKRLVQINHELEIMNMVNAVSGGGGGGGKTLSPSPSTVAIGSSQQSQQQQSGNEVIWQPELKTEEFPDDREEITEEEIKEYQLKREKEEWKKVIPPKHHIYTGVKTVIEDPSWSSSSSMKGKFLLSKSSLTRNPFVNQNQKNSYRLTPEEMEGRVKLSSNDSKSSTATTTAATVSSSASSSPHPHLLQDTVLCFKGVEKLVNLNHQKLESSIPVLSHIKLCTLQARYLTEKQVSSTLKSLSNPSSNTSIPNNKSKPTQLPTSTNLTSDDKKLMNEYRRQLLFEKQYLQNKMNEYILSFDTNVEDLRHDRHVLTSNLKLSELKLLTYVQEYNLLLTYEEKDNYLKSKNIKYKNEKLDIETQSNEIQMKLDFKCEDLNVYMEKLCSLFEQYKGMIPGHENNQFYEILTKIYKKKIKRIKTNLDNGNDGHGNGVDEDEDVLESDDDDDDDNEYDDEDIDDICPNGCDVTLYDQIIALREKKLDVDEMIVDLQKTIDELKKAKERLKQREKQIDKELKASEIEIQNFQRQKQGALNKIEVYIPLRISQIHAFVTSGVLSGPAKDTDGAGPGGGGQTSSNPNLNTLTDGSGGGGGGAGETADNISIGSESIGDGLSPQGGGGGNGGGNGNNPTQQPLTHEEKLLLHCHKRSLTAEMDLTSHTVFKTINLEKLSQRIQELKYEIIDAKNSLKSLHKEKIRLEKERSLQKEKIELWTEKSHELQMLKFGRLIDLDVLEAGSDKTKEKEGEVAIVEQELIHQNEMNKLLNEYEKLKSEFAEITRINTEYLQNIANLTDRKLQISYEMNAHSSGGGGGGGHEASGGGGGGGGGGEGVGAMTDFKDHIEREKLSTFIQLQSREIESLKTEITMLRRKETAQFANYLPAAPPMQSPVLPEANTNKLNKNFTLPPIPNPHTTNHG